MSGIVIFKIYLMSIAKSIEKMSFEEALQELEQIVKKIDSGQETLESSISDFERGAKLREHCEKKIQEAKLKIEKITKKEDGTISSESINLE